MSLFDELAKAAARGVEVIVLTNGGGEPPTLSFKWDHKVYNDCAISKFRACGYDLVVVDCDGDRSFFELRRGRTVLARGETSEHFPMYHFDACLMAAEAALRAEVARRKQEISAS